jgi:radical SAM superfamily enzyme YgiQ (UPF0313 family)
VPGTCRTSGRGPHAILYPDQFAGRVDLLAGGEADWESIDMVERGQVSGERIRLDNLDALPLPAYDLAIDQEGHPYITGWHYDNTAPVVNVNTSRSCPFDCSFCDVPKIWGRKWHGRSAERVVEDVIYLRDRYG